MAQKRESDHCRLFFILARNADMGVIFRRGPSKWVQIIRWDTVHDTFEPGQWFHGRIYEKRCDLSPDGTLMIYQALKLNRRTIADTEYSYTWTAISHPPYLTALALWPGGYGRGGGLFETNRKVWLNHGLYPAVPHPDHLAHRLDVTANATASGEYDPVLFRRLERDGWTRTQECRSRPQGLRMIADSPRILVKTCPQRSLSLAMVASIVEFGLQFRFVVRGERGETSLDGAACVDWDRRGRLVYVRAGKLYVGNVNHSGTLQEQELADFNAARPEPRRAPYWSRHW